MRLHGSCAGWIIKWCWSSWLNDVLCWNQPQHLALLRSPPRWESEAQRLLLSGALFPQRQQQSKRRPRHREAAAGRLTVRGAARCVLAPRWRQLVPAGDRPVRVPDTLPCRYHRQQAAPVHSRAAVTLAAVGHLAATRLNGLRSSETGWLPPRQVLALALAWWRQVASICGLALKRQPLTPAGPITDIALSKKVSKTVKK